MTDANTLTGKDQPAGRRWLLLVHQLPPKPDYLRVKIRRRLRRLGAVAVKQTVYLLPNTDEALEDLHWLREEIGAAGGSAVIVEAAFIEGLSDEEIDAMLMTERHLTNGEGETPAVRVDRVVPGRTWVTRHDVHVDRIASAWLIRRFIDLEARFKFVQARGYVHGAGELRFDMFEAEYTHVAEDCTFQTLLRCFAINDPALASIGEIVHDIDCKDERYGRAETAGFERIVRGIADAYAEDAARLERGGALLDDLYTSFIGRPA